MLGRVSPGSSGAWRPLSLLLVLAAALIVCKAVSFHALAQSAGYRSSSDVPIAWQEFAILVKNHFRRLLAEDGAAVRHLGELLGQGPGKSEATPLVFLARAWIAADGTVERIQFSDLENQQVAVELRHILTRGSVGAAPPLGMLQPLHIRLSLAKE